MRGTVLPRKRLTIHTASTTVTTTSRALTVESAVSGDSTAVFALYTAWLYERTIPGTCAPFCWHQPMNIFLEGRRVQPVDGDADLLGATTLQVPVHNDGLQVP
jgi:hypothetical protein